MVMKLNFDNLFLQNISVVLIYIMRQFSKIAVHEALVVDQETGMKECILAEMSHDTFISRDHYCLSLFVNKVGNHARPEQSFLPLHHDVQDRSGVR